ncbi:alpha/beta hydrolase [Microbacterium forte]
MTPDGALTIVSCETLRPRLREIILRTESLVTPPGFLLGENATGETGVRILLPPGYDDDREMRYPVLYLLHGGGESFRTWTSPDDGAGRAEEIVGDRPLVVVMPDGGVAGGYADWFNGGAGGAPRWATYHLDELIPWVDSAFRTIADRSGRAIAGLSMGGAAVRYAAQRPELFGATAGFSGDVDILQPASEWRNTGRHIASLIWGDVDQEEARWRAVNGPDLAENLRNTDVALYTGDTGEPESTFILGAALAMRERLDELGIPVRFTLHAGMSHDWRNFNRSLSKWLPDLVDRLRVV